MAKEDVKYGEYAKVTFIFGLPQCHICGETTKKLGAHSYMVHNIKTADYREMFGLNRNTKLMCEDSIEIARQRNYENWGKNEINLKKGEDTRLVKGEYSIANTRESMRPERLNFLKDNAENMRKGNKNKK